MGMRASQLRARVRRAVGDERGITLVELMVAILVLGILSTMVVNLYVQTQRAVTTSSDVTLNTKTASNIMNEMSRVIRSSSTNPKGGGLFDAAIVDARPNTLTVLAYVDTDAVNPKPVRVQFAINATTRQIIETRWSAKPGVNGLWTFDAPITVVSTRTLPGAIVASGGSLFTYFKADRTTEMVAPAGGLDEAKRLTIAAVKVNLLVQASQNASAKPLALSNMVGLPNLGLETETTP